MSGKVSTTGLSQSRGYIRHPSGIPIKIVPQSNPKQMSLQLNNVSVGGLCFDTPNALPIGGVVKVTINSVKPVFKVKGIVQWCEKKESSLNNDELTNQEGIDSESGEGSSCDGLYVVGIEFIDPSDAFHVRMVEQVCHIEQYKRDVKEAEGRKLSSQKAAIEWIAKHGAEFPNPEQSMKETSFGR